MASATQPLGGPWPTVFLHLQHIYPSAARRVGDGAVADATRFRQATVPICMPQVRQYQQSSVASTGAYTTQPEVCCVPPVPKLDGRK